MMGLFMLLVIVILWITYICSKPIKTTKDYIPVKGEEMLLNGVRCKEDDKFYFIETYKTEMCPFCKSEKIFSDSWTNEYCAPHDERCEHCGASHMLGVWLKLKE